jgi:hypothetical protein
MRKDDNLRQTQTEMSSYLLEHCKRRIIIQIYNDRQILIADRIIII